MSLEPECGLACWAGNPTATGFFEGERRHPVSQESLAHVPRCFPVHQPFKMPGWPVRIDGRPTRVTASPMMGEHTEQVLSEWLGLSGEAVAALKADGAL
jgi:crotonobetainyl-CoA:carnitine CoA-transferase CaiB-like acyl-CoA transferase